MSITSTCSLRPDFVFSTVAKIDFAQLHQLGITKILVDLDGTLAPALSNRLDQPSVDNLLYAMECGWIEELCVFSNCGVIFLIPRLFRAARRLNAKWHAGIWPIAKPSPIAFNGAIAKVGGKRNEIAIIGDQLKTDIWGGNKAGIQTILVTTLEPIPWWKKKGHTRDTLSKQAMGINC